MYTIGLCGGSGSGKGVVCQKFLQYGIPNIDTDEIYRSQTAPGGICLPELREVFGDEIISTDGSLDRKALSKIVFYDKDAEYRKSILEKITHKHILSEVRARLVDIYNNMHPPATIVDAPLLFESGFNEECNIIIAVICDEEIRINRIIERDNITREQAKARISTQLSDEVISARADFTIINNGVQDLDSQVAKIAQNILRRR